MRSFALFFAAFLALFGRPAGATEPRLHEPLYFDLVRQLGARAGELEANTLVSVLGRGEQLEPTWAPEIEVAVMDGLALELELPHAGDRLDALKASAQLTLPGQTSFLRHGLQIAGEHALPRAEERVSGLFVLGVGLGRFSALSLIGARAAFLSDEETRLRPLANATLFYELGQRRRSGSRPTRESAPGALNPSASCRKCTRRSGNTS